MFLCFYRCPPPPICGRQGVNSLRGQSGCIQDVRRPPLPSLPHSGGRILEMGAIGVLSLPSATLVATSRDDFGRGGAGRTEEGVEEEDDEEEEERQQQQQFGESSRLLQLPSSTNAAWQDYSDLVTPVGLAGF